LKTGKFALFGCVQEIHRELYFMLNTCVKSRQIWAETGWLWTKKSSMW